VKVEAGHPIPDNAGLEGVHQIFELAKEMRGGKTNCHRVVT
jgi:glycerate-2-kinase